MRTAGDRDAERGIEDLLARGPADVVAIAAALRAAHPGPFAGAEGSLHALLLRLSKEGRVVPCGRAASGATLWAKAGAEASAGSAPLDAPGPAPAADVSAALRVAAGVRDAEARGRVVADVLAHRAALAAAGRARQFGSAKHAALLVRRVDRGRTAVCLPSNATERVQQFLFHEGPSVLVTLLALFAAWWFAVEPRVIPSNSMRPGLRPGDRVVVWKVGASSTPERWSVLVFRRTDGEVLIKRAVGLPGERFHVENGEAYANDRLLVKPDAVREAVRERLFDERFEGLEEGQTWTATKTRPGAWRWQPPLYAHLPAYRDEHGNLETPPYPAEEVHDVYVEAEFGPDVDRAAGLWIEWVDVNGKVANTTRGVGLRLEPGAARRVRAGPTREGAGDPDIGAGLAGAIGPGDPRTLSLSVVDGVMRASAGGAWSARGEASAPRGRARLHVEGDLRRIRIDRDVHYTTPPGAVHGLGKTNAVLLGPDALFLLGDHSGNSRDSRFFEVGLVRVSRVIGRSVFRVWPPLRIGPTR